MGLRGTFQNLDLGKSGTPALGPKRLRRPLVIGAMVGQKTTRTVMSDTVTVCCPMLREIRTLDLYHHCCGLVLSNVGILTSNSTYKEILILYLYLYL